jgi:hypothetical protein
MQDFCVLATGVASLAIVGKDLLALALPTVGLDIIDISLSDHMK